MSRRIPPKKRKHEVFEYRIPTGTLKVGVGYYDDGTVCEVFIDDGNRPGESVSKTYAHSLAMITSLAIQHGCPLDEITDALLEFKPDEAPYIIGAVLMEASGNT